MPIGVVAPRTMEEARTGARARARGGRERAAARRRHLAVPGRPSITRSSSTARNISTTSSSSTSPAGAAWSSPASCSTSSTASSSRTGCGFRSISRPPRAPPSAAWSATIPAARARCATATPARTCSRSTRCWRTATSAHFGPVGARPVRSSRGFAAACRWRAICWRSARARRTRSRRASRRCSAGSAATISTRSCPAATTSTSRISWSAPKARSPSPRKIELKLSPLLGARAVGACHFGSFVARDGCGAAHRQARPDRGRAGRPHHARPRARDRDVPADDRRGRARRPRGDPVRRVRRGRSGREFPPAAAPQRADGRPRLRLGQYRRKVGRRDRGARCQAAGARSARCAPPASTS